MRFKKIFSQLFGLTTIRFLLVGVLNTIVGTGVMFFLYNIVCCNYWFSSAMNYIVGSIVSFFLNKHFTFKNNEKSFKQVVNFIVNISVCYILAYGLAKPLVASLLSSASVNVKDNIAMLFGMIFFVVINYICQRYIVFKSQENKHKVNGGK